MQLKCECERFHPDNVTFVEMEHSTESFKILSFISSRFNSKRSKLAKRGSNINESSRFSWQFMHDGMGNITLKNGHRTNRPEMPLGFGKPSISSNGAPQHESSIVVVQQPGATGILASTLMDRVAMV